MAKIAKTRKKRVRKSSARTMRDRVIWRLRKTIDELDRNIEELSDENHELKEKVKELTRLLGRAYKVASERSRSRKNGKRRKGRRVTYH